jgi:hypothetical protein
MRKVLLATTALVALGGVSAAQAEVSVSGSAAFDMEDDGSGTTFNSDGSVVIKGTFVTDSGLTVSAVQDQHFHGGASDGDSDDTVQDAYISISGDFGTIMLGKTDDALDRMDGTLPENMDLEGTGDSSVAGALGGDTTGVNFMAPKIGGLQAYATTTAEGAKTGFGVNYSNSGFTVMYQQDDDGGVEGQAVAGSYTMAGVKVAVGSISSKTAAGVTTNYDQVGVSYTMGDLMVVATNQKSGTNKYNNIGAKYTIAPGLTFSIENGSQGSTSSTWASIGVKF